MEFTTTLLNAFINDLKWRNKVADLLGSNWDNDGDEVFDLIWDKIYDTWGELGANFINEYIADGEPFIYDSNGKHIYATNIDSLVAILNEFFLVKEEEED